MQGCGYHVLARGRRPRLLGSSYSTSRWPNLLFRGFIKRTASPLSFWHGMWWWLMNDLSPNVVSFFSSFFSFSCRKSSRMSSFLFIFQVWSLCFWLVILVPCSFRNVLYVFNLVFKLQFIIYYFFQFILYSFDFCPYLFC